MVLNAQGFKVQEQSHKKEQMDDQVLKEDVNFESENKESKNRLTNQVLVQFI